MATTSAFAAAVVSAIVLAGWSAGAAAQPALADVPTDVLERAFWRCDYAATRGRIETGTAMQCSVVTEAFKARRFGGDFHALHAWWRQHKDAEHLALGHADRARAHVAASN